VEDVGDLVAPYLLSLVKGIIRTPTDRYVPTAADLRAQVGTVVERLIAMLDAWDGDPDQEPEEDAEHDGLEADWSDYEPDADREPEDGC